MTLLQPGQLRRTYDSQDLPDLDYVIPAHKKAIIGQERAVKALKFGLGSRAPGFNVYVAAPHGDEKISIIQHFLKELAKGDPLPADWCYVNNFKDNYCPVALRLPQGTAKKFQHDIENFILEARNALIRTLESEEYGRQQNAIKQELAKQQQEIFRNIQEEAKKVNFVVKSSPMEIVAIPLLQGKPMSQSQFEALSEQEQKEIQAKQNEFQKILGSTIRKSRDLERKAGKDLMELERKAALFAIEDILKEVIDQYQNIKGVVTYMEDMKQHILDNLMAFLKNNQPDRKTISTSTSDSIEHLYQVNILVDNADIHHAPIVVELNPTYNNLFGKIERESVMGTLVTDFTLIRSGALHQANGGYLIVPVEDLLRAPFSYDHLKRSIRNRRVDIEDPTERYGLLPQKA